jgi:hypothetical protein
MAACVYRDFIYNDRLEGAVSPKCSPSRGTIYCRRDGVEGVFSRADPDTAGGYQVLGVVEFRMGESGRDWQRKVGGAGSVVGKSFVPEELYNCRHSLSCSGHSSYQYRIFGTG